MSNWTEGPINRELPHFALTHDSYPSPVAVIGHPAIDGRFAVEFLVPRDSDDLALQSVVGDVLREIGFYLDEAGGPNPWEYARYHCGTTSNAYSTVHWGYFEPQA